MTPNERQKIIDLLEDERLIFNGTPWEEVDSRETLEIVKSLISAMEFPEPPEDKRCTFVLGEKRCWCIANHQPSDDHVFQEPPRTCTCTVNKEMQTFNTRGCVFHDKESSAPVPVTKELEWADTEYNGSFTGSTSKAKGQLTWSVGIWGGSKKGNITWALTVSETLIIAIDIATPDDAKSLAARLQAVLDGSPQLKEQK